MTALFWTFCILYLDDYFFPNVRGFFNYYLFKYLLLGPLISTQKSHCSQYSFSHSETKPIPASTGIPPILDGKWDSISYEVITSLPPLPPILLYTRPSVCPLRVEFQVIMLLLLFTSVVSDSVRPHRWQPTRLPCPWDSPGKNTGVDCHFLFQCMKVKSETEVAQSCPTPRTPWTAAYQAPLSMGFSRQEYWSRVPLPSPSGYHSPVESLQSNPTAYKARLSGRLLLSLPEPQATEPHGDWALINFILGFQYLLSVAL